MLSLALRRLARSANGLALGLTLVVAATLAPRQATAQIGSDRYASIVVDAATGNILSAANMDASRYPASLTKMMTLYMLFEALRDRRIGIGQYVPVSPDAASMPPTKLGLVPGSLMTVEQGIFGLVTKSANDAAAALGEMLGGDEDRFAQMMTLRARALGMTNTQFRNASGLPDWNQVTSARDMAILARRLLADFPGYYHYFSTPSFIFNGRYIPSHQRLLQTYPGADGFKTGYIEASGYNVVTSAIRGDTRLIGVVFGASNGPERDAHMAALLDAGFERMGVPPVYMARREPPSHFAAIIPAAHAAPSPYLPYPQRYGAVRGPAQSHGLARTAARPTVIRGVTERRPVSEARPEPRFDPRLDPRAAEMRADRRMPTVMARSPQPRTREPTQAHASPRPGPARPVTQLVSHRYPG